MRLQLPELTEALVAMALMRCSSGESLAMRVKSFLEEDFLPNAGAAEPEPHREV